MKATPVKDKGSRAFCESCESWVKGEELVAYLVREEHQVHESTYSTSRFYYSEYEEVGLFRCANCGDILVNTDDGDETDILWQKRDVWWECSECNKTDPEKEVTDVCCT